MISSAHYDTDNCYADLNDLPNGNVKNFLTNVNLSQHRIATVNDIERHMDDGENSSIKTGNECRWIWISKR